MRHSPASRLLIAALTAASLLMPAPGGARAGERGGFLRTLTAPIRAAHREPPATCRDPGFEQLTREIDWLRRRMDATGSIVAQHPDIWGQSRLTRHRAEYEKQLQAQLGGFRELANAHLRRSDQAFLGMALQLAPAATTGRPGTSRPTEISANVTNLISNPVDGTSGEAVIARTAPFAAPARPFADFGLENSAAVSLEPTIHLDHLSRYVHHLQALRRINEGDDIADSPGYALNLVRIPVSITPGQHTLAGHGAEITITAQPQLGGDLLHTTFRNLVINDLVDALAPVVTHAVNSSAVRAALAAECMGGPEAAPAVTASAALHGLASRSVSVPSAKSRRARMPFPPEQLVEVIGERQVVTLLGAVVEALGTHPASAPCIDLADVRAFFAEELAAASDFLEQPRQRHAWDELPGWNLAELVRSRRAGELELRRRGFFESLGIDEGAPAAEMIDPTLPDEPLAHEGIACQTRACQGPCSNALPPCRICRTTTAVLAWAILVESALLDARLAEDIRASGASRGQAPFACAGPFYGPDPSPEARAAFDDYVRRRWPLRVFALDPVSEEQNVADEYAQRREMQIAMAIAYSSGRASSQALTRYARRLETDLATISLNKTAIGFTHGADTFGWRFYPRIQPPPTRGTVATLTETLCGSSTTRDLASRRLEGGQRECTAIIVMPSFVPLVSFDVRTSWFSLTHPQDTEQSLRETLLLSRSLQSIQEQAGRCLQRPGCYRPGEMAYVQQCIEMLDRRMPRQSMLAQIPHENDAGGFELFNTGVTDLAPELIGWYGGPGIDPAGTTTLFLLGKGFSVHDTSVIAGGRPVKAELVSRQLLRAEIPPGVLTIKPAAGDGVCQAGSGPRTAAARQRPPVRLASNAEPLPAPAGPAASQPADGLTSADRPSLRLSLPAIGGGVDGVVAGAGAACCETAGSLDCHAREMVDIHLATPYGVSGHLLIPVVSRATASAGRCDLGFSAAPVLRLTATKTKADTWRVNEYYEAAGDTIRIAVPPVFAPPARATVDFVLRDVASGATAGTFTIPAPPFDARTQEYVLAGGDLRNFVGDTSRPATDKTLRGAVKPYLDSLGTGITADGKPLIDRNLALTASLVTETKTIPIDGTVTVEVRRADQPLDQATDAAPTTAAE
jgi:hypothetical protein